MASDDKSEWIRRVLGVDVSTRGSPVSTTSVLATWRDAKENVDGRINALANELKSFGDPDLTRIGELGLFGITSKETVALNAALFDYERAPDGGKDAAKAKLGASIKAYRAAVDGNEIVELIDTAPFSTKVALRATMFSALSQIENSLAA